jgi:hypothetical protein
MFSSDQRFLVSGDNKDDLRKVLALALELRMYGDKPFDANHPGVYGYMVHPKHGLIFTNEFDKDYLGDPVIKYSTEMTLTMLVEQVYLYLESPDSVMLLHEQRRFEGDGGVNRAWEVHAPSGDIIAVKPAWTYYAK